MMNDELRSSRRALVEIALIFAVFFIQGAWPVPDVNEAHYLGKAIHYWNPDWLRGDLFMESTGTHVVFCLTFGWLSLWLSPPAMAWTIRILTWLLLAWAWRRLSVALVPRPWYSVLTAALFACLMDRCHMAGEWVIGGAEAKGFAYVLVLLGLEAFVRNRWNRALMLLGAASALHVVVGGWAAVAVGFAWLITPRSVIAPTEGATAGRGFVGRPPLSTLWPGILGGFVLALPGLVPALTLDWGVDSHLVRQAHEIYVFDRLPHHLILSGMRPEFIARMTLLWLFWLLLGHWSKRAEQLGGLECPFRLRAFVAGAVAISLVGAALQPLIYIDRAAAAGLLRCYWFRLTDVALPLGVVLQGAALIAWARVNRPAAGRAWLALALVLAAFHVGDRALDRLEPAPPRSQKLADFDGWRDACRWVADSGKIPPGARFLTPRLSMTFKWYTGHSDVATWKDVPQEARAMMQWWQRINDLFATGQHAPRWHESLAELGAARLKQLGAKYDADYVITQTSDPPLGLPEVYQNRSYAIYRLR
jgi:hypothetical protein